MSDNTLTRREALQALGLGTGAVLIIPSMGSSKAAGAEGAEGAAGEAAPEYDWTGHHWGYLVDTTKCIGCCACMRACRAENDVPAGKVRTWVERYRIAKDGTVTVDAPAEPDYDYPERDEPVDRAFFVPKLCNHCENSVCSQVCPVGAAYITEDGVVLDHCIGCGYCVQACPYGSRFINPIPHVADKCTLCYHRITKGLPPACVASCPTGARIFGDLADPQSRISQLVRQLRPRVLRPDLGTHPKCFYASLDHEVI